MSKQARTRLSDNQRRILQALGECDRGWMCSTMLHKSVFGSEFPRRHGRRSWSEKSEPYSGSQRASLCRSLRRLCERGLIERFGGGAYRLTTVHNCSQSLTGNAA